MTGFAHFTRTLDYAVYVVTAADERERSGCLVGFGTQCSIDPPRYLVCISKANHTYGVARRAEVLAVHLLDTDRRDLAELFGGQTGDEVDKFAEVAWREGPGGVPVLEDCPRWFAGQVVARHDVGDHEAFVLEPIDGAAEGDGPYLTFQATRTIEAAHPA